jgi:hypothetical protein
MENVLGIVGIFFVPITMIILIVWFKTKERIRRYELQADLYAKALEKGQPIPPDLFEPSHMKYAKEVIKAEVEKKYELETNPLYVGIICMAAGAGISLFMWLAATVIAQADTVGADVPMYIKGASTTGLIPFLIGLAFLIIHFIQQKNNAVEHAK